MSQFIPTLAICRLSCGLDKKNTIRDKIKLGHSPVLGLYRARSDSNNNRGHIYDIDVHLIYHRFIEIFQIFFGAYFLHINGLFHLVGGSRFCVVLECQVCLQGVIINDSCMIWLGLPALG